MENPKPSILLVDDEIESIQRLRDLLYKLLGDDVELIVWQPTSKGSTREAFDCQITEHTALVVTDYDLTTSVHGLFGPSIVDWCQSRAIPVGDFSRAYVDDLPTETDLFELRVPPSEKKAAAFIENTFKGFQFIRTWMDEHSESLAEQRSLATVLATLLDSPNSESMFAAYMTELAASNSALLQMIRAFAGGDNLRTDTEKARIQTRILAYVLGHVLANAVLKYPGPIISLDVLCAYMAANSDEGEKLAPLFEDAKYQGPFGLTERFYWREKIDSVIDELSEDIGDDQFESFAEYNRHVVERKLGRRLDSHTCERCDGQKGGFWCPFTSRAVCERGDCSVPASSWIPAGAQLSRVEKDFYDEWAPMLSY